MRKFELGGRYLGPLPQGGDLVQTIEAFCRNTSIQMAVFSVIGSVSSFTIGVYDQRQQVYVTYQEESALQIVNCTGNVSLKHGEPFVNAQIALSDQHGQTIGGRLFSETIVFAGELDLQELTGTPLSRAYDQPTGLMLWKSQPPGG